MRLPVALLAGFLQRLPALQGVVHGVDSLVEAHAGLLLKAAASFAALGALDSVAGATVYSLATANPAHPSPYTVAEGAAISPVVFVLQSNPPTASPPESWTISGSIPPGLKFGVNGTYITAPGFINTENPTLVGTPTTAGTYTMVLQAWEFTGGTGIFSSQFNYQVVVTAAPTPTPTPTPTPAGGNGPAFTTQPLSVTVTGGTVALDALAPGAASYQWMVNGSTPVAGATDHTLLISNAAQSAGTYTCVATDASGTSTSDPATVSLTSTPDVGRMVNISARAAVGTGGNIIFGGFAIGGSGSLPVLIRASGPALVPFGVPGTLPDPQLQLFDHSGVAIPGDINGGWAGNSQVEADANAVGAFPWTNTSSHDAALDLSLATSSYTAQVAGESGDTGVALMEVYDATAAANYASAPSHLTNLSARVFVGSNSNALFAGFVIKGSTAMTVLIRASGPALQGFGVPGTLPDPTLTLEYQSSGAIIASNAGWGGDAEISSTAKAVGGFAWTNPASLDSALLITLPPGNYTALVAGASGDAGVALVEVYEVP